MTPKDSIGHDPLYHLTSDTEENIVPAEGLWLELLRKVMVKEWIQSLVSSLKLALS